MHKGQYNADIKLQFRDSILEKDCSFDNAYTRMFEMFNTYEYYFGKDLYDFTPQEIYLVFKGIANKLKYTSILTYNSLVKNYKDWVKTNINKSVSTDNCSVDMLKTISNCKQYVILNENDILNLTQYNKIDGANYNIAILLKLFWEIDGQEDIKDLLRLKINDVDFDNATVSIFNSETEYYTSYKLSNWLLSIIKDYAKLDGLTFLDRQGVYKILTAEQNNGYIFRLTWSYRTKAGKPMDGCKFSNLLTQFCDRQKELTDKITINDMKMSLALRHMLKYKKTHEQMHLEQRYFKSIPSNVYADMFNQSAKDKFPKEYLQYVEYYKNIEKRLNCI